MIGSPTLKSLELIRRIDQINAEKINAPSTVVKLLEKHSKVFMGLGCIKNFVYDIKLKEDVKPSIAKCRKIPLFLHDKVKIEIEKMVKDGVIKKVSKPTDWAHPIVIVKKRMAL